ncbi:MAG: cupin domain-containing protein [Hyphomicrobiales bacterium]
MPKIDISALPLRTGTGYPEPLREIVNGRQRKQLGDAGGLTQFGVNYTRLKPGAASAHRHWHEAEDELVYVLEGELVLVEDEGETILGPGDAAAFKAGVANGHHLVNRSGHDAVLLEIGTRSSDERCYYPDVDLEMVSDDNGNRFVHKSGEPY